MMSEPLTKIAEWTEVVEEGRDPDEWPYPTTYVRSIANGELAERCRRALGVTDPTVPVYVTEACESSGYSEFTQEHDYEITVVAGDAKATATSYAYSSERAFAGLIQWLNEKAPVAGRAVGNR